MIIIFLLSFMVAFTVSSLCGGDGMNIMFLISFAITFLVSLPLMDVIKRQK